MQVIRLREIRSGGMIVVMKHVLLTLCLLSAGCDLFTNLDDIAYQTLAEVDSGQDLSADFSLDSDGDLDAGDMAADFTVDITPDLLVVGGVCEAGGMVSGGCEILEPSCAEGLVCTFIFNNGALQPGCVLADRYTLEEGADCTDPGNSCEGGLICEAGICRRACERATGFGCLAEEFCKVWEPTSVYGYCADAC